MECTQVRDWLFRKIDGELSDLENTELEGHLAQCGSCNREYKLLILPQWLARIIPDFESSPYFYRILRMHIESGKPGAVIRQISRSLARQVFPAFAVLILAFLLIFAYLQLRTP